MLREWPNSRATSVDMMDSWGHALTGTCLCILHREEVSRLSQELIQDVEVSGVLDCAGVIEGASQCHMRDFS